MLCAGPAGRGSRARPQSPGMVRVAAGRAALPRCVQFSFGGRVARAADAGPVAVSRRGRARAGGGEPRAHLATAVSVAARPDLTRPAVQHRIAHPCCHCTTNRWTSERNAQDRGDVGDAARSSRRKRGLGRHARERREGHPSDAVRTQGKHSREQRDRGSCRGSHRGPEERSCAASCYSTRHLSARFLTSLNPYLAGCTSDCLTDHSGERPLTQAGTPFDDA